MTWTSSCAYIMSLTLSGTAMYGIWLVFQQFGSKRGYYDIVYSTLQAVSLFSLIPFSYCFFIGTTFRGDHFVNAIFCATPLLESIGRYLGAIWVIGVFVKAVCYLGYFFKMLLWRKRLFVSDVHKKEILEKCKKRQGVSRQVSLWQAYGVRSPFVMGIIHPKIVIPAIDPGLTEKEWECVFTHELVHIRHRDIVKKFIVAIINCIHWFNPIILFPFNRDVEEWCEISCDQEAEVIVGDRHCYYETLLKVADNLEKREQFLVSCLSENRGTVIKRIERMEKCKCLKRVTRGTALIFTLLFLFAGSGAVFAASKGLIQLYDFAYVQTEVAVEEVMVGNQLTEYITYEEFGGTVREQDSYSNARASVRYFDWIIQDDETVRDSSAIYKSNGSSITVAVYVEPTDKNIRVGIIDSKGTKRYVIGKDMITHTFAINTSGSYRFYIENQSGAMVYAEGSYK